jgi:hypothetical protein
LTNSLTAPAYRDGWSDYLRALAQHLNTSPLGKAVVGLHIVAGTDGQWFKLDWRPGAGDYDYSEGALAAFRDWLLRRYGNDVAAFRQAWSDDAVTFDTATLPAEEERSPESWFLDPESMQPTVNDEPTLAGVTLATRSTCSGQPPGTKIPTSQNNLIGWCENLGGILNPHRSGS